MRSIICGSSALRRLAPVFVYCAFAAGSALAVGPDSGSEPGNPTTIVQRPAVPASKSSSKGSESISFGPALSMEDLIASVEKANPDIQAAREAFRASATRPDQERSLPDPMIGFMWTNMNNPLPFTTVGEDPQSNAGVAVSQEIPFPGKLNLKGQIAEKESKRESKQLEAVRLNILAQAKAAFYELYYAKEAGAILGKNRGTLKNLASIAQARYESGEVSQADVLKASLEVGLIDAQEQAVKLQGVEAAAEINALLGRPAESPLPPLSRVKKSVLSQSFEELLRLAQRRNPVLMGQAAGVEQAKAAQDLAKREYYPDMTVGGYYGDSGDLPDMWQFRVDFKVPLYFWTKQRQGVSEAAHKLAQANHERVAATQSLDSALKTSYSRAKTSENLLSLYQGGVGRDAQEALESSLSSYQVGKVDFLMVLTNALAVRENEMRELEELVKFQKALASLEELSGASIIQ